MNCGRQLLIRRVDYSDLAGVQPNEEAPERRSGEGRSSAFWNDGCLMSECESTWGGGDGPKGGDSTAKENSRHGGLRESYTV